MATREQRAISKKVLNAVEQINEALVEAGIAGLFIEIRDSRPKDSRVPRYTVDTIEIRETVLF